MLTNFVPNATGIAQLSDVYVPFPYIAPILCAVLLESIKTTSIEKC